MKFRFLLPAVALLMAGCSDPSAPTESNFRKAIETALASEPICETADIYILTPVRKFEGPPRDDHLAHQKLGLVDIKRDSSNFPDSNTVTPEWATPDVMRTFNAKPPQHDMREIVLAKMNDGWRAR